MSISRRIFIVNMFKYYAFLILRLFNSTKSRFLIITDLEYKGPANGLMGFLKSRNFLHCSDILALL